MEMFVLLSGPISVGKSWLGNELIGQHGFKSIRTGAYLVRRASEAGLSISRQVLQAVGDELDVKTDCRWIVDDVAVNSIRVDYSVERWLLDSVRKRRQVDHLRSTYGDRIFHVHLGAPEPFLKSRYEARRASGSGYSSDTPYEVAIDHPNEVSARALESVADLIIDVSRSSTAEAIAAILDQRRGRVPCDG